MRRKTRASVALRRGSRSGGAGTRGGAQESTALYGLAASPARGRVPVGVRGRGSVVTPVRGRGIAPAEGLGRAQQTPRRARLDLALAEHRGEVRGGVMPRTHAVFSEVRQERGGVQRHHERERAGDHPNRPAVPTTELRLLGGGHLGVRVVVYRAAPDGGPPLRAPRVAPHPDAARPRRRAREWTDEGDPTRTGRFWDAATVLGSDGWWSASQFEILT